MPRPGLSRVRVGVVRHWLCDGAGRPRRERGHRPGCRLSRRAKAHSRHRPPQTRRERSSEGAGLRRRGRGGGRERRCGRAVHHRTRGEEPLDGPSAGRHGDGPRLWRVVADRQRPLQAQDLGLLVDQRDLLVPERATAVQHGLLEIRLHGLHLAPEQRELLVAPPGLADDGGAVAVAGKRGVSAELEVVDFRIVVDRFDCDRHRRGHEIAGGALGAGREGVRDRGHVRLVDRPIVQNNGTLHPEHRVQEDLERPATTLTLNAERDHRARVLRAGVRPRGIPQDLRAALEGGPLGQRQLQAHPILVDHDPQARVFPSHVTLVADDARDLRALRERDDQRLGLRAEVGVLREYGVEVVAVPHLALERDQALPFREGGAQQTDELTPHRQDEVARHPVLEVLSTDAGHACNQPVRVLRPIIVGERDNREHCCAPHHLLGDIPLRVLRSESVLRPRSASRGQNAADNLLRQHAGERGAIGQHFFCGAHFCESLRVQSDLHRLRTHVLYDSRDS